MRRRRNTPPCRCSTCRSGSRRWCCRLNVSSTPAASRSSAFFHSSSYCGRRTTVPANRSKSTISKCELESMPEDFESSKRSTLHDVQIHEPVIEPKRAKRLYIIIGIAVVLLLVAYGVYAMVTSGKEGTDDAQVTADVVPIASRVAGQVVAVHVIENQPVHRGDLIAEIDPRDAEVKVAQAQSDLDTARAQAAQADANATVLQATAR